MEKVSLKKNLFLSTLYQILLIVAPLITAPYVSRILGAGGIGTYSYTNSIQIYFSMFAALGTASYGAREIARVRDDEKKRSHLFWEIEFLSIISSSICIIIWLILIIFSHENKIYFIILTLNIINTMLDISWFYTGMEQFKYTVRQNSIFKVISIICIFLFVKESDDIAIYILIMSLSTLLGTASMWLYLPKFINKIELKTIRIKKHFKETLIYFIPTIATSIYTVLDKTLIGIITKDTSENGYYEQATKIINVCKTLTFVSLNSVLGSRISFLYSKDKQDEIVEKIKGSFNYVFFMGIGIMFGLLSISAKFVPIFFGDGYKEVITLIELMSPLILIIGISNCLGAQYYIPSGLRNKSAKFIVIGSLINLILNLLLIPNFKSYGAVMGSIVAELTISILYILNCNKIINIKFMIQIFWKKFVAGIIMFILLYVVNIFIKQELLACIIDVILGISTYVLVLIILRDSSIYLIKRRVLIPIRQRFFTFKGEKNDK